MDYAIDFLRRRRDRPFFAYLPTMTPHAPHDAPDEWVEHHTRQGRSPALARLWGMVSFLDQEIGRLLAALDELGLAERTIVVFMSDNGPAVDAGTLSDEDRRLRKVTGLRGWKGDLFENGVRSPLFLRWAGRWSPREIDAPLDLADLAPTLLELAGAAPLPDAPALYGRSFAALLDKPGAAPCLPATIVNYAHRGWLTTGPAYSPEGIPGEYLPVPPEEKPRLPLAAQSISVREGRYKLILNAEALTPEPDGRVMLFDLAADPRETTDVGDRFPAVRSWLRAAAEAWWTQLRREPHAFEPPVFLLQPGENRLPAPAPDRVAGAAYNTVRELKGWRHPGDGARYALRTESAGLATVTAAWRGGTPSGGTWRLRVVETGDEAFWQAATEWQAVVPLPAGACHLEVALVDPPPEAESPGLHALRLALEPARPGG